MCSSIICFIFALFFVSMFFALAGLVIGIYFIVSIAIEQMKQEQAAILNHREELLEWKRSLEQVNYI